MHCIRHDCCAFVQVMYMYMYIGVYIRMCSCFQLEKEGSLSAEELARLAAVSITLASERYNVYTMNNVLCMCSTMCMHHNFSGTDSDIPSPHSLPPSLPFLLFLPLSLPLPSPPSTFPPSLLYCRLLITEKAGKACRDDSVEGLRFYPNRFLTEVS